jgi:hypothetical protein
MIYLSIENHGNTTSNMYKFLENLENNQLNVKRSKCSFGEQEVEYLGHMVSREVVKVDPQKIQAITKWPIPKKI